MQLLCWLECFPLWELEAFLFTSCKAFLRVCVSCSLIGWICLSLCLSAWLSLVSYPKEGLAGRWSHAHTHTHRLVPQQPHRNQVIEQSLYPGIPDITERQKICMKEGLLTELPSSVCLCMCVFCSKTTPWFPEWEQALVSRPLPISLSLIPSLEWVLTDCQPASEHANESITIHIYTLNPSWNVPRSVV